MKIPVVILLLPLSISYAHAEIWECVDKDSGSKRYTNIRADAKGCRAMNLEPINNAPSVRAPQESRVANFPSVDSNTQKQRDLDRRRILDQELAQEETLLAEAKKVLADQQAVRNGDERNYARALERMQPYQNAVKLHEDNIANLRKEIANIKQ